MKVKKSFHAYYKLSIPEPTPRCCFGKRYENSKCYPAIIVTRCCTVSSFQINFDPENSLF